jgi:hypothetical protein
MQYIEAAARKNDPSLASQAHEKMALWMPTAPLSHDHRQKSSGHGQRVLAWMMLCSI